jgi:pyruvate,orthophosphate dikinase
MFIGERRELVERLIVAEASEVGQRALDDLATDQRGDFEGILEAMDGLPVTIRLIDPPLHEFLPDMTDLAVEVALADERGEDATRARTLLEAVHRLHEQNPMLGLRGVRLGLVVEGLFGMQVKAIADACVALKQAGKSPKPEIMVPLVATVQELELAREEVRRVLDAVSSETGVDVHGLVGTMIEVPRACLTAGEIAAAADFFSFGTNDLTQMTWGFSRDDVEAAFFSAYMDKGIFGVSPFETIDEEGVGELVRMTVQAGREVNPGIHLGICGEHGGDPESVHFFDRVGLDYVSCSPFRVPVARLEAGRAAVS